MAYKRLTVEKFLDDCRNDQRHYQLFDGVIVAMAWFTTPQQNIAPRLGGEIYASLGATRPDWMLRVQAGIAPKGLQGLQLETVGLDIPLAILYRGIPGMSP